MTPYTSKNPAWQHCFDLTCVFRERKSVKIALSFRKRVTCTVVDSSFNPLRIVFFKFSSLISSHSHSCYELSANDADVKKPLTTHPTLFRTCDGLM